MPNTIQNKSCVMSACDVILSPPAIAFKSWGKNQTISVRIIDLAKRILFAVIAIVTVPLAVIALSIKWFYPQPAKAQSNARKPEAKVTIKETPTIKEKGVRDPNLSFEDALKQDMVLSQQTDQRVGPAEPESWRVMAGQNEKFQTLIRFTEIWGKQPANMVLNLTQLGDFSKTDLKVIQIVSEFLKVFHGIEVKIHSQRSIEGIKEAYIKGIKDSEDREKEEESFETTMPRIWHGKRQYKTEDLLTMLGKVVKREIAKSDPTKKHHLMAFTNEDIFTDNTNYTFGMAYLGGGLGLFSINRFGDPEKSPEDFRKVLELTMKIAAHEFGHMRGLSHCTDYDCNIGGYWYLPELAERTFLYCSEDSAKICLLTNTPMEKYYKNLLEFFQNFKAKFGVDIDFSKEIRVLEGRIAAIA
jgi:archaemetzincin